MMSRYYPNYLEYKTYNFFGTLKCRKYINLLFFFAFLLFLLLSNGLYAQSKNSDAAAKRLEETLGSSSAGIQSTKGGTQPTWVTNPYTTYSKDRYIAAVGFAANRAEAEKKAFAALVAVFGQSIKADLEVATIYSEAVANGRISVSENTHVRDTIATAASLNALIGAEIGNVWEDGRGTINALAFIERPKAITIYTDLIILNQRSIENLTAINATEKNTLAGYARYKLAALIAGINVEYTGVVSVLGGSTTSFKLIDANSLNIEAQNIIRNIAVGFNVNGDNNNRVRAAFAKVLNSEGLRTQGSNTPYILDININMSEAKFPNSEYISCRYSVNANLIEKSSGNVLFPFSITSKDAHATYEEAQARAYLQIERIVAEKYPAVLKEYFTTLLSQK